MFGKGALIYVAGFALVFSVYLAKMNRLTVSASDSFNHHYMKTLVHESAATAMNFAINHVWQTNTDTAFFNITAQGCTSAVSISSLGTDTVMAKVVTRGAPLMDEMRFGTATKTQLTDSMYAVFAYNLPLSRYFWYTNIEGHIYWVSNDTTWGPMHTNDRVRTLGTPVFYKKVSAQKGISPSPTSPDSDAEFLGGWEVGTNAQLPTDMTQLTGAAQDGAGSDPINTSSVYNRRLWLEFLADGTVVRRFRGGGAGDTLVIADIAPTGVLYSTRDIVVKGTFNGQLTVYSGGTIKIDDDLVYADHPLDNPDSDDILGLVADRNILLVDNVANNSNVEVHACLMAINGSFGAQNYADRPDGGVLRFIGSIAQDRRGPVGTVSAHNFRTGFSKRYHYDSRLETMSPPHYPYVRILNLISWWE